MRQSIFKKPVMGAQKPVQVANPLLNQQKTIEKSRTPSGPVQVISNQKKEAGKYDSDIASALFGSVGEAKIENLDSDKEYCVSLFQNGLWEKRETTVGSFIYQKYKFEVPYLTKKCEPEFKLKIDKIPVGILNGTVAFFRSIMKDMGNSESMVQIWLDKSKGEYFLYVPVQKVSGASIRFEHSEELQNNSDYSWIIDIHSHNTMSAFFSSGDNADEKSTRLFGVLGHLGRDDYASKWRAGCNGNFVDLELEDIFDLSKDDLVEVTEEDRKKVEKLTYSYNRPAVTQGVKPGKQSGYYFGGYPKPANGRQTMSDYYGDYWDSMLPYGYGGVDLGYPGEEYDDVFSTDYAGTTGESRYFLKDVKRFVRDLEGLSREFVQGHDCNWELENCIRKFVDVISVIDEFDEDQIGHIFDQLYVACDKEIVEAAAAKYFEIEFEDIDIDPELNDE